MVPNPGVGVAISKGGGGCWKQPLVRVVFYNILQPVSSACGNDLACVYKRRSHLYGNLIMYQTGYTMFCMHFVPLTNYPSMSPLQFDFPFVETHRCKEINLHVRLKETWKHMDYGFDEIEYEMDRKNWENRQKKKEMLHRSKSVDVIEELCMSDSEEDEGEEERSLKNGSLASGINSTGSSSQVRAMD